MKQTIDSCEKFLSRLDAYIDCEMPLEEKEAMEAHAQACPACREELAKARDFAGMMAELDGELPVPLPAQVAWRKAVRAECAEAKKPVWARGNVTRIASLAAVFVVLLLGGSRLLSDMDMGYVGDEDAYLYTGRSYVNEKTTEYASYSTSASAPTEAGKGSLLMSDGAAGDVSLLTGVKTAGAQQNEGLKIIRSAEREIKTTQYDADYLNLTDLVSEHDAYFEENSVTGDAKYGRTANMVIRVPAAQLDSFLTAIDVLGEVTYRYERAEDVSERYSETEARLSVLRSQLARLEEMVASAESVEELILIEERSSEIITEIEVLEGRLRGWDSQVNYSRVSLTMWEKVEAVEPQPEALGARMREAFVDSVDWLKVFGEEFMILLSAMVPRLLVWIPAIVVLVVLVRVIVRTARKRR